MPDEIDADDLPVTGEIPRQLRGCFLRNGPNPAVPPLAPYRWFGGDGMVHGIWLEEGGALRYRNRWVRTFALELERRAGRALFPSLGPASEPVPEAVARGEFVKNAANTHVVRHGGRILCLFESGEPYELDEQLNTLGAWRFGGALAGPFTAHPKIDPATGDLHAFAYSPFPPFLRYYRVDAGGSLAQGVELAIPRPVMMHDFAVTERAAIFLDSPLVFDLDRAMSGGAAFEWQPQHGMRLGIMPFARPTAVRWYEIPDPGYVFHTYNAWCEEAGRTVLLCGRKPRVSFDGSPPREEELLWRYTVDEETGGVTSECLSDLPTVLPRVDERRLGRLTRRGYAAGVAGAGDPYAWNALVSFDLTTGAHTTWRWPAGAQCGEPVFAPDPGREDETAGWILQLVQDPIRGATDLCILDAAGIEYGPIARVHLPRRVPDGFHGSWLPGAA